jgi:hypothetical protein
MTIGFGPVRTLRSGKVTKCRSSYRHRPVDADLQGPEQQGTLAQGERHPLLRLWKAGLIAGRNGETFLCRRGRQRHRPGPARLVLRGLGQHRPTRSATPGATRRPSPSRAARPPRRSLHPTTTTGAEPQVGDQHPVCDGSTGSTQHHVGGGRALLKVPGDGEDRPAHRADCLRALQVLRGD